MNGKRRERGEGREGKEAKRREVKKREFGRGQKEFNFVRESDWKAKRQREEIQGGKKIGKEYCQR